VTALIARDRNAQCTLLGDRHLAVPIEQEEAFRTRLRGPGYTVVNR
jgi:hypothetical protein